VVSGRKNLCALVLCGWAATLAGCSSNPAVRMGGFPEAEARARLGPPEPVEACTVRTGRLAVEVERALVREYPHHGYAPTGRAEQPLIVTVLTPAGAGARPELSEVASVVAKPVYRPGEPVHAFTGRRLLDRPLRTLGGARLTIRLAENDRTSAPRWATLSESLSGAVGVASLAGAPAPPAGVVAQAIELLRELDKDDLILLMDLSADDLGARLAAAPGRVLRLRTATTRLVSGGPERGRPSAELDLLVLREPEAGCP
jgi:hypothetical protein